MLSQSGLQSGYWMHGGFWILEAAFRSLLMAAAVWGAIRLLRVQAVLAQKLAWALVLAAAGIMPLVMNTPWLALDKALRIPVRPLAGSESQVQRFSASQPAASAPQLVRLQIKSSAHAEKPSPLHSSRAIHAQVPAQPSIETLVLADARSSTVSSASTSPGSGAASVPVAAASHRPGVSSSSGQLRSSWWSWPGVERMLALIYMVAGGLLLLRISVGLAIAFRIWRSSKPIASFAPGTIPLLETNVSLAQGVRISLILSTPVTIGSTVILPLDCVGWDEAKLRVVLAHEQSHVRQGDFYLQLLAAVHAAVFWFSPLGWWLQRKLSELGEALSDRAGLEQAANPASYAQILLEFAAMPRPHPLSTPLAGVAMARSKHLSSRIERILNAGNFRKAFTGGRRHAVLAVGLVPVALIAVVACIRIVPAVEAAQAPSATTIAGKVTGTLPTQSITGQVTGQVTGQISNASTIAPAEPLAGQVSGQVSGQISGQVSGQAFGQAFGQVSGESSDQVTSIGTGQEPTPAPAPAPVAPNPSSADVEPAPAPEPVPAQEADTIVAPQVPAPPDRRHGSVHIYSNGDDDRDSFAIVHGDHDTTVNMGGYRAGDELEKARQKVHGDFIWFEHDGKSYVVTDPSILAQSQMLFKGDEALNRRMAELDRQQGELNKKMEALEPEMQKASLPGPEFEAQMKKLQAQLAELQSEKFKKLTDDMNKQFSQEKLAELQEKMGNIQGQLGEIQGKIGEREGLIGEKQGELGEQMGRLGEEMGKIGEQQGKMAEEASRRLKSILDQAIGSGKAKPVE